MSFPMLWASEFRHINLLAPGPDPSQSISRYGISIQTDIKNISDNQGPDFDGLKYCKNDQ